MKTFARLASIALAGVLAAAPAWSQGEIGRQNLPPRLAPQVIESASEETLHRGKITSIDHSAKTFTIETRTGAETFTLWHGGQVVGPDQRRSFDALAVGHEVTVKSIPDENERWLARTVQLVDPHEVAGQLEDAPAFDVADTATVTSVDPDGGKLRVQTAQGPRVYQLTEKSRIRRNGRDIELSALRQDERVVVSAQETGPGEFMAKTVTVVSQQGPSRVDAPAAPAE